MWFPKFQKEWKYSLVHHIVYFCIFQGNNCILCFLSKAVLCVSLLLRGTHFSETTIGFPIPSVPRIWQQEWLAGGGDGYCVQSSLEDHQLSHLESDMSETLQPLHVLSGEEVLKPLSLRAVLSVQILNQNRFFWAQILHNS